MTILVQNFPTIWNMYRFIKNGLLVSLLINGIIYISWVGGFLFELVRLSAFLFIYFVNLSDDEKKYTIEDYDIFDKTYLNSFKEYVVILTVFTTFFISISYCLTIQRSLDKNNLTKIDLLNPVDQNLTILNFKYNSQENNIIFSYKDSEHNLTNSQLSYLKKLNISFKDKGYSLRKLKQEYRLSNKYLKYIISFFIIFTPFFLISNSSNKPRYHLNSLLISFWVFLMIFTFHSIISQNIYSYIQKILLFIDEYKYVFTMLSTWILIGAYFVYSNNTKEWNWNNLKISSLNGGTSGIILSLFLFFILFNFCFTLNIFLSTFLLIIMSLSIIYPFKQLSLMNKLKAKK